MIDAASSSDPGAENDLTKAFKAAFKALAEELDKTHKVFQDDVNDAIKELGERVKDIEDDLDW